MKKTVVFIVLALMVLLIVFAFWSNRSKAPSDNTTNSIPNEENKRGKQELQDGKIKFGIPKKSAHYESNTPSHGVILAAAPINVVLDFNFDLANNSSIIITNTTDSKEYGVGETTIDSNKLTMRRLVSPTAPNGVYTVSYKACWPDKTCHDGSFQFAIDSNQKTSFLDLRNKPEVSVRLSEIKFTPQNIRVSKGTKVVWVNDDNVEHYVNTDSHPSHTYYLEQNSKALKQGDIYSTVFNIPGVYPYHCSAHADSMKGSIIVEE